MNRIENKNFSNETIELDGNAFINCSFNGSHLVFRGNAPFGFGTPKMSRVTLEFADSARLTLQALDALYKSGGSTREWVEHVIQSFKGGPASVQH